MRILITGGSGYVGSHLAKALLGLGHQIISFDLNRMSNQNIQGNLLFVQAKSHDLRELHSIDKKVVIDAVVHLAAKKSVLESTSNSTLFRNTNIDGSINVARFVADRKIPTLINASSAAVYGNSVVKKIDSKTKIDPSSVYGETKAIAENSIREIIDSDETNFYNLRCFNIAGYGDTYRVKTLDVNIFPKVASALVNGQTLSLYGVDFDTRDGTCIRDFIHVTDVVKAMTSCLELKKSSKKFSQMDINVCTGIGTSMLEVIRLMESCSGESLKTQIMPRRKEDPKEVVGDPKTFIDLINGKRLLGIDEIAKSTWRSHVL